MITKQFLIQEYKKACKKGRYYYAWVILQNLQRMTKSVRRNNEYSNLFINEKGIIINNDPGIR